MSNSEILLISDLSESELDTVAAGWDIDQLAALNVSIGIQVAPTTNVALLNFDEVTQTGSGQYQLVNAGNIASV